MATEKQIVRGDGRRHPALEAHGRVASVQTWRSFVFFDAWAPQVGTDVGAYDAA